jgi:uncharacterized membrane protein YqjE
MEKTPPEAEGVAGQLKAFASACAAYAAARLKLAAAEGREAAGHAGKLLLLLGALLAAAVIGWLFVCLAGVFLLAKALGPHGWAWASLIMAAAHFLAVFLLAKKLRSGEGRTFFPLTTAEFQKDQESLDKRRKP